MIGNDFHSFKKSAAVGCWLLLLFLFYYTLCPWWLFGVWRLCRCDVTDQNDSRTRRSIYPKRRTNSIFESIRLRTEPKSQTGENKDRNFSVSFKRTQIPIVSENKRERVRLWLWVKASTIYRRLEWTWRWFFIDWNATFYASRLVKLSNRIVLWFLAAVIKSMSMIGIHHFQLMRYVSVFVCVCRTWRNGDIETAELRRNPNERVKYEPPQTNRVPIVVVGRPN